MRTLQRVFLVTLAVWVTVVAAADKPTLLKPGTKAPPFSLPALDGKRQVLRVWCGDTLLKPYVNSVKHTVIINFWATYCKPCQKEIPEISAFMKKHTSDPIKAFFVSIDKEGVDKVGPFVENKGYDITVLLDTYARTANRYGVKSVPALFVVSPEGDIFHAASGFAEGTNLTDKLESIWGQINAGQGPSSTEVEIAGDKVSVKQTGDKAPEPAKVLPPKERWQAVVRTECGEKPEDVAADIGVDVDAIRKWSKQLKQAAIKMWSK